MKMQISMVEQFKVLKTEPSYDINHYSKDKANKIRSNTGLGYNLNFFDMSKARKFFSNPTLVNDKIIKQQVHTPRKIQIKSIKQPSSNTSTNSLNDKKNKPYMSNINSKKKGNNCKVIQLKKKIGSNSVSPTINKTQNYYKSNHKPLQTYTNRIKTIEVYKTGNNTISNNNTSINNRTKNIHHRNEKKVTNGVQPSFSQENKFTFAQDIIPADLISEQERRKAIIHNDIKRDSKLTIHLLKKESNTHHNLNTKNLTIDTKHLAKDAFKKHKTKSSNSYPEKITEPTKEISKVVISRKAFYKKKEKQSLTIERSERQTCSFFKNRYKNLINDYILSTSEADNVFD